MNDNFRKKLKESGLSVYALSRASGVPYTTVSEIKNCKTSINKCSLQTVYRLAAALGAAPEEISDEILYLDGTEGVYEGIRYRWDCDKTSKIEFSYDGKDVVIDFERMFNIPSRISIYNIIAGWRIKSYLENLQWKEHAHEVWRQKNGK